VAEAVTRLLDERPEWRPLLVETGPCRGDGRFADAITPLLPAGVERLPATAPLEDVVAALATSAGVVGSSLHGSITAFAYGRPFVVLDLVPESKLTGFCAIAGAPGHRAADAGDIDRAIDLAFRGPGPSVSLASLQQRIDDHFDRVAAMATAVAGVRRRRA